MATETVHIVSPDGLAKHTKAFRAFNDERYAKKGESGEGGTSDYDELDNKPSLEGVTIEGDKLASDYGLALLTDIPDVSEFATNGEVADAMASMSTAFDDKLTSYATKVDLEGLGNYVDASIKAVDDKFAGYAKSSDLNGFASETYVDEHIKAVDDKLSGYATKGDISDFQTSDQVDSAIDAKTANLATSKSVSDLKAESEAADKALQESISKKQDALSLPLTIAQGGTGKSSPSEAWTALGGGSVGKLNTGTSSTTFLRNDGTWQTPPDTKYTLPLAASGTRGGVQLGFSQTGKKYPLQVESEKAFVEVPWTDTDTKVNQNHTTANNQYPVLLKANTGDAFTSGGVNFDADVTVNPSTGILKATGFSGPLTGNVTGNVTGSSGSCTGNAATATKATSADTATTAGNVTGVVAIANGGTGKNNAADAWTALGGGSVGKLNTNASSTQYLRGDGTWQTPPNTNTDTNATQNHSTANGSYPVLLKNGTGTGNITSTTLFDGDVTVNPSTGVLKATGFEGDVKGNATSATTADSATWTSNAYNRSGNNTSIWYSGALTKFVGGTTTTGSIKIILPHTVSTADMIRFKVSVYDYITYAICDYYIQGYVYPGSNNWYPTNTHAMTVADYRYRNANARIRFGATSDGYPVVEIGESTTTWAYLHVVISEMTSSAVQVIDNLSSWKIVVDATDMISTVSKTVTNPSIMNKTNLLGSIGAVPIANGGTGKTTAEDAWTALGGGSVGKLDTNASTSNFLRGDGTWATPPNTNTNVTQNHSTANNAYPVLLKNGTGTGNVTSTSIFDADVTVNPSTGVLKAAGFEGPLTGNVTGSVTGSSGSCTGNAATATKLGTATKGSATKPIYLNAGAPTECTPYPIGSEIRSTTSISPATLYGGTWTLDSTYHDFRGIYIYRRTA